MSRSQRQPESLTAPSRAGPQHPEVRIRFTLADGLFALLRKPPNSFGWVGTGSLRFEGHGVSVTAMRRPFFGLRWSRRFVSAFEIREVYREGAAVRVDLRQAGDHRPFFWFWSDDAVAAAAVVKLLPAKRSIEFDDGFPERFPHPFGRRTRVPVLALTLTMLLAAALLWSARSRHETRIPVSTAAPAPSPSAVSARAPSSRADIVQARAELDRFDREMSPLEMEFASSFRALQKGGLSQPDFTNRLERSLVPQWQAIERELTSNAPPIVSAAAGVRADLMTSALNYEHALRIYDAGLQVHDENVVLIAFEYLKRAEDARRGAEERIRELEGMRPGPTP